MLADALEPNISHAFLPRPSLKSASNFGPALPDPRRLPRRCSLSVKLS
ncbi:hypothetical protein [Devosia sp. DBB001]|nr:hypothetical protein [Devosia sp. DBB001]